MKNILTVFVAFLLPHLTVFAQINLAVGDSSCTQVPSDQIQFSSQINVEKGETYEITAFGEWQDASFHPTNANGFKGFTAPMFFGMLLKPMPSQYYMMLCGRIGPWKFPIGTSTKITVRRSGELKLYANDAKGFFDNNSGTLQVTVRRLE
jgi:hypothetical protein